MVLRYRGRAITAAEVAVMRALVARYPEASRRRLSQHLCAAWGWVQPNGAPRDLGALRAGGHARPSSSRG